jgi:hypothetical protein
MPKDQKPDSAPAPSKTSPASATRDGHGTPFKRVPGPGPNDVGKGAAGANAIDRVEGGLERVRDQDDRDAEAEAEDDK